MALGTARNIWNGHNFGDSLAAYFTEAFSCPAATACRGGKSSCNSKLSAGAASPSAGQVDWDPEFSEFLGPGGSLYGEQVIIRTDPEILASWAKAPSRPVITRMHPVAVASDDINDSSEMESADEGETSSSLQASSEKEEDDHHRDDDGGRACGAAIAVGASTRKAPGRVLLGNLSLLKDSLAQQSCKDGLQQRYFIEDDIIILGGNAGVDFY